jgi:DNA-binding IclR family transcriptional regulator
MSKISEILEMLGDGQWHRLEEIQERIELNEIQIQQITDFLRAYNFIETDRENKNVKINEEARRLVVKV